MSEHPPDRQIAETALAVLEAAITHLSESRQVITAMLITQPVEGCEHKKRIDIVTAGDTSQWLCPTCGEQSG